MSFENGLKTIVVATDLEGQAEAALEYARKLAANYGARIVLAHGLDPMEYAAVDALPGNVLNHLTEAARKVLDKLAGDLLREGIHSHSEVRQGDGGGDAGGRGAAVRGRADRDWHQGHGRRWTGGGGRHCRTTGEACAMPGAGGGGGLECRARIGPRRADLCCWPWSGTTRLQLRRPTAYSLAETFERPLLVLHVRTAGGSGCRLNPCAPGWRILASGSQGNAAGAIAW